MKKKVIVELELQTKSNSNDKQIRDTIEYHINNLFKHAEVVQIDVYNAEGYNNDKIIDLI